MGQEYIPPSLPVHGYLVVILKVVDCAINKKKIFESHFYFLGYLLLYDYRLPGGNYSSVTPIIASYDLLGSLPHKEYKVTHQIGVP